MKRLLSFVFLFIQFVLVFSQQTDDSILNSLNLRYKLTPFDVPSEIMKFNKDTIIVAGFLQDIESDVSRYYQQKNVIYKTTDGGLTWKINRFNGDSKINDVSFFKNGEIWMCGSDNCIHYSNDYGETWIIKQNFSKLSDDLNSIFMVDSKFGFVGGYNNCLFMTNNNWQSVTKIETPFDQLAESKFNNSVVLNILIIDTTIFIEQSCVVSYSSLNKIEWRTFNFPVLNFMISENKNEIDIKSRNNKHFIINSQCKIIRSYNDDIQFDNKITEKNNHDTNKINLSVFFKSRLCKIEISTENEFENNEFTRRLFNRDSIEKVIIIPRKNKLIYESKTYKSQLINLSIYDLIDFLTSDSLITQLQDLDKLLSFSEEDFYDYKEFLKMKREFLKRSLIDCSYQVSCENPYFDAVSNSNLKINSQVIFNIFEHGYSRITNDYFDLGFVKLVLVNGNGEKIIITNEGSRYFSLPWSIKYNNQEWKSYNPNITKLVRKLVPEKIISYKMLLGGEFIYCIIEQQIIEEL